jgi:drug/metabolite transporter (DMT)-like permease
MSTALLTLLALTAFAANSLLCRMALGANLIDPVSFTVIRLGSGAIALVPLAAAMAPHGIRWSGFGTWRSALSLVAYAIAFSLAYRSLSTGTGALLLFGCVQATMIGAAVAKGDPLGPMHWTGVATATAGLAYLVSPGLDAPDPGGAALMLAAGAAWGLYSLRGRTTEDPVISTAGNFSRALLLAIPMLVATRWSGHVSIAGAALATVSGTLTSGLGYVVWYATLPRLTATQAGVVQLLVPAVAALGGVLLLDEPLSFRLVAASLLTLGGIAVVVRASARDDGRGRWSSR